MNLVIMSTLRQVCQLRCPFLRSSFAFGKTIPNAGRDDCLLSNAEGSFDDEVCSNETGEVPQCRFMSMSL